MTSPALPALAALAALAAAPAWAALGEPAASVAADGRSLAAARKAAETRAAFTVERLESGAHRIREYVAPSGVVFAVTWDGFTQPNLSVLLGRYAAPVRKAAAQRGPTAGHRQGRVDAGGAVVESWGRLRSMHGRAWVPALLPPGVTPDDLR